jgi:hypothetical protein
MGKKVFSFFIQIAALSLMIGCSSNPAITAANRDLVLTSKEIIAVNRPTRPPKFPGMTIFIPVPGISLVGEVVGSVAATAAVNAVRKLTADQKKLNLFDPTTASLNYFLLGIEKERLQRQVNSVPQFVVADETKLREEKELQPILERGYLLKVESTRWDFVAKPSVPSWYTMRFNATAKLVRASTQEVLWAEDCEYDTIDHEIWMSQKQWLEDDADQLKKVSDRAAKFCSAKFLASFEATTTP